MSFLPEVMEKDFDSQVLESDLPVLVDFWAPWCNPCRMMTPVLESLAVKLNGQIKVVKLNTDENFALARKLGIQAIPCLLLFNKGRESQRLTGFLPQPELEAWVKKAMAC